MQSKVLVAYDTVHGSTAEIAEFIGQTLVESGTSADVLRVSGNLEVSEYAAVVLGCPIIFEKLTEHALEFIRVNQSALGNRPLALFVTSLDNLLQDTGEERVQDCVLAPLLATYPNLSPIATGIFPGVLDYSKYSQRIVTGMRNILCSRGGPGEGRHDYRDWDGIRTWASGLIGQC